MILNFKTQIGGKPTNFVEKIKRGEKIHTIRKGNRWKVGDTMHMSTGARTKNYSQFNKDYPLLEKVVSVQEIQIRWQNYSLHVFIDGVLIVSQTKMCQLVESDGFDSLLDFHNFFKKDFDGQIVHWTDIRY